MNEIISKEEADKWMSLKGEVKGTGMMTHADFILKEEGEEGLKKIEETMARLGHPIQFRNLKKMALYPLGLEALVLELMKRIFGYSPQRFQEIGEFHAKSSLIVRLFMKYFCSFDRMAQQVSRIWDKYFTVGKMDLLEADKEKRRIVLRVRDFRFHPLHCQIMIGTLSAVVQMVVNKKVVGKEKKCIYRGDESHEFVLTW